MSVRDSNFYFFVNSVLIEFKTPSNDHVQLSNVRDICASYLRLSERMCPGVRLSAGLKGA